MPRPNEDLAPLGHNGGGALPPPGRALARPAPLASLATVGRTPIDVTTAPPAEPPMIVRVWRKYRLLLFAAAFVWLVPAVLIGKVFKKESWQSDGVLLYTPMTPPENLKGVYAIQLTTYANQVRTPEHLDVLIREFDLPMPEGLKQLEQQLKVDPLRGGDTIRVSLEWPDREQAAAMVNRLMALFIQSSNDIRRKSVLRLSKPALEMKLGEVTAEIKRYKDFIREYQEKVRNDPNYNAALVRLTESGIMRREQLQDNIRGQEDRLNVAKTLRDIKFGEVEELRPLVAKRYETKIKLDKAEAELKQAETEMANCEKAIKNFTEQLRRLPTYSAENELLKLEGQRRDLLRDIQLLENPDAIQGLTPGPADERTILLQKLLGSNESEFIIQSKARPGPYPMSTTRKLTTAMAFALPLLLLFLGLAAREARAEAGAGKGPRDPWGLRTLFEGVQALVPIRKPAGPTVAQRQTERQVEITRVDSKRMTIRTREWMMSASGQPAETGEAEPTLPPADVPIDPELANDVLLAQRMSQWLTPTGSSPDVSIPGSGRMPKSESWNGSAPPGSGRMPRSDSVILPPPSEINLRPESVNLPPSANPTKSPPPKG
jgi:tetratricopeptide (TPR) repeat protein